MVLKPFLCVIVLLFGFQVLKGQVKGDPPDLVIYIADIRASRMTESAYSSLNNVARIQSGTAIMLYKRDDEGNYSKSFQSTICPIPNASKKDFEKWSNELKDKTEEIIKLYRPLADTDSSGFVSTEEGWYFQSLFDFAVGYEQISPQENGDLGKIAAGLFINTDELQKMRLAYIHLLERAKSLSIEDLPVVN